MFPKKSITQSTLRNFFLSVSILSLVLFSFLNCISVRVYIPKKGTDAFDVGNLDTIPHLAVPNSNPHFEIEESLELKYGPFANRIPSLFVLSPRRLNNEYGSVGTMIARELDRNRNDYKTNQKYTIFINSFELKTEDFCFGGNNTSVKLDIDVLNLEKKENLLNFHFEDSIESNVTDCNFVLATGTIVGWLIYMPYLGFRGNREDQLNQLGRTALLEFSEKLKFALEKSAKTLPPQKK
ncbi:hypothetical protein EHQ76_05385 [Leptospira barantonii]|uniref:Uncharacterized protein n=2 Tax=Leptospira barantonii TaxID=2023184 RepID=A0A5F2BNK3_9LEPT|nr:hypothetical protein [Leptospira barantonii]TGM07092.1 hypothetical protein EHQ76_05385 [Leptospira barantonii]